MFSLIGNNQIWKLIWENQFRSYNNMGISSDINMLGSCMFQMCLNIYYKLYLLKHSPNMLYEVWH